MDFDCAKENIQPLAVGRNASILQASLQSESSQELLTRRQDLEQAIHSYQGDDPLEAWYEYIAWIEQSFPSGGKESGFEEVLKKCLIRFDTDSRYFQDRRLIKLYIKFFEMHKDQNIAEFYQQLFNCGIGTMVSDFYISWAYCYDLCGNYRKADEIFQRGIACRAEPIGELQEAREHFGFTVAQRFFHENDESATESANKQLEERRRALSSLRRHRKQVGSLRTGAAVHSYVPGTLNTNTNATTTRNCNVKIKVFIDEKPTATSSTLQNSTATDEESIKTKSVVRSIIEAVKNLENKKEPGRWNKSHDKRKGTLFSKINSSTNLGFDILEDESLAHLTEEEETLVTSRNNMIIDKPFKPFPNFNNKNKPLPEWITPVTIENTVQPRTYPQYNKCKLYPRPNREYQLEELLAYKWFCKRGISNNFTEDRDIVWKSNEIGSMRQYPNFAKKSRPQVLEDLDAYFAPEKKEGLVVYFNEIYNNEEKLEREIEEVMAMRWREGKRKLRYNLNDTILIPSEMDETLCISEGEQSNRRISFLPPRKSMTPMAGAAKPLIIPDVLHLRQPPIMEILEHEEIRSNPEFQKPLKYFQQFNTTKKDQPINSAPTKASVLYKSLVQSPYIKKGAEHEIQEEYNLQKSLDGAKIFMDTDEQPTTSKAARAKSLNVICPVLVNETSKTEKDSADLSMHQDYFEFKTPRPLTKVGKVPIPFDIYEDCREEKSYENPSQVNDGSFETDETCSTQAFNFFIKSQSVSTPNVIQKLRPRVFGTILKDKIDADPFEQNSKEVEASASISPKKIVEEKVIEGAINYSSSYPQQLSTILETTEHGTNTKSTVSSPKSESLETGRTLLASQVHLSKVEEHNVDAKKQTSSSSHTEYKTVSQDKSQVTIETSVCTRFRDLAVRNATVFEDHIKNDVLLCEHVGNFSRLEEREDTAPGFFLQPIKFQEDKTETITKILSASKTIPVDFQDELTHCRDEPSTQLKDDKTETHNLHLLPPCKIPEQSSYIENSFDFFTQTPPKSTKVNLKHSELCSFDMRDSPRGIGSQHKFDDYDDEANKNTRLSAKKSNLLDFSIICNTQSDKLLSISVEENKSKDLLMPTEGSQPKYAFLCTEPISQKSDSFFKDSPLLSISRSRLTTLPDRDINVKTTMLDSFDLTDLAMVADSQSNQARSSKSADVQVDNPETIPADVYMEDFSAISNLMPTSTTHSSSNGVVKGLSDKANSVYEDRNIMSAERKSASKIQANSSSNTIATNELFGTMASVVKLPFPIDSNKERTPPNSCRILSASEHFESHDVFSQSFLRSSTLVNNEAYHRHAMFLEESLHIKEEKQSRPNNLDMSSSDILISTKQNPYKPIKDESFCDDKDNLFTNTSKSPINTAKISSAVDCLGIGQALDDYDDEMSIYVKHTPKTPKIQRHLWNDSNMERQTNSAFEHLDSDLNETQFGIEHICLAENVNPFNINLIGSFLEEINFTNYINELPTCELIGKATQLHKDSIVKVNDVQFKVQKLIGEGGYGAVFCATEANTGKKFALKQERPPNYWEYYICLEVHARLKVEELIPAFMSVDYALIARNSSILISPFSSYGSLISVCNKIKKITMRNVDEYVVMHITCLLLEIVDHLHALEIIHADIKADNFLLMQKLSSESTQAPIQLIDFGVSIDMQRFNKGQTFLYSHKDDMKCVEMRENRPWTYQLDLYGLAGVIHVLLFGKYMDVHKTAYGVWMHKTFVPRYLNKPLWENIFRTLLNIRDCSSMPNLQNLRVLLKEEIAERENYFIEKIFEFNRALDC